MGRADGGSTLLGAGVRTLDHLGPHVHPGSNQAEFERLSRCACTRTPGSNQSRVRTFRSRGEPDLFHFEPAGRRLTAARLFVSPGCPQSCAGSGDGAVPQAPLRRAPSESAAAHLQPLRLSDSLPGRRAEKPLSKDGRRSEAPGDSPRVVNVFVPLGCMGRCILRRNSSRNGGFTCANVLQASPASFWCLSQRR